MSHVVYFLTRLALYIGLCLGFLLSMTLLASLVCGFFRLFVGH